MDNSVNDVDFECILCLEIFLYPVTLPCNHRFCKHCFDKHCENNGFTCPLCRRRVSNWLRKLQLNAESIVDIPFWEIIKKRFNKVLLRNNEGVNAELSPELTHTECTIKVCISDKKRKAIESEHAEVKRRAHDLKDVWRGWHTPVYTACRDVASQFIQQSAARATSQERPKVCEAKPGEINQEYREHLQRQEEERKLMEEKNFTLSQTLINMIEEEDRKEEEERKKKIEEQLRMDEELARMLQQESEARSSSIEVLLRAPSSPKQRKYKKPKTITISSDKQSGYTDATNSSPYKNSEEFNNSFFGGSLRMGPSKRNSTAAESIILSSSSDERPMCCSTPEVGTRSKQTLSLSPIPLDTPSTSKQDIFADYWTSRNNNKSGVTGHRKTLGNDSTTSLKSGSGTSKNNKSCVSSQRKSRGNNLATSLKSRTVQGKARSNSSFFNRTLSHFTPVMPGPSTSTAVPDEKQASMSRSSSGADSIGQELRYFKPVHSFPTTPPKEGSSKLLPQLVLAQKGSVGQELNASNMSIEEIEALFNESGWDSFALDVGKSMLEQQLEVDRTLAYQLQAKWNSEQKKILLESQKTGYNLRTKKKCNLNVMQLDRTQTTLDGMMIK